MGHPERPGRARALTTAAAVGFVVVLLVAALLRFATTDLRWALGVGVGLCWAGGRLVPPGAPRFLGALLVAGPLCVAFHALVVAELPSVAFFLPAFGLAALVGTYARGRAERAAQLVLGVATTALAVVVVPRAVEADLFEEVRTPAPAFTLVDLGEDAPLTRDDLAGRVVLLDFFGTWCGPCVAALPELERAHAALADYPRVTFLAVCTNELGDEPDDALAFARDHALPYAVCFDRDGRAHEAFGFSGVPSLVVLDGDGHVRLRHEGYNPSEDLAGALTRTLRELLDELGS